MGFFSLSRAPAPCAPASTNAASEGTIERARKPVEPAARPAEQPILTDAEQLDLLIGGARLDDTEAKDKAAFLVSNKRHSYVDALLGCAVYTFSGLQHIQGQSNALTLLTMWTVGTTFLVDAGERRYLQDAVQGTLPNVWYSNLAGAAAEQKQFNETMPVKAGDAASQSSASASAAHLSTFSPAPVDAGKLAGQQRNIFMTQTVASWVWMLASFQQFKVHKRLKWCGYSSWMGLGCVSYYTTRHVYNLLVA
ncbi:hypothetical protein ABL78_1463 [Leptomonas seymouri]|uniref:Uncharacterized protein n=1 Tax=Leptomonas seymouri TaxID=5684 RepID=A0A0N0P8E4_LEPSE|nr:hypothetical protein ABL78_1463 [Leptomonas seymouri]|eukprot:KPI89427.1 hypothetical protein ABL78_1463 [Leptomonas seymouri]